MVVLQVSSSKGSHGLESGFICCHTSSTRKKHAFLSDRWQTETGAHMITPLPGATPLKPGSATKPFFGVVPAVLNEQGKELEGPAEGLALSACPRVIVDHYSSPSCHSENHVVESA